MRFYMMTEDRLTTVLAAATLAVAVALSGCASHVGVHDVAGGPDGESFLEHGSVWHCVPVEGPGTEPVAGAPSEWLSEDGRMVATYLSAPADGDVPGSPSPQKALDEAVSAAAEGALRLLEQRGIAYSEDRRVEIVGAAVEASRRGDEIEFPRISVTRRLIERCVADGGHAPADTCWRAAVDVRYPIGLLRGDANNVRWERSRIANEALVLKSSAEEHLAGGRWMDGLLDLAKVAAVVSGSGLPVGAFEAPSGDAETGGGEGVDDRDPVTLELVRLMGWSRSAAEEAAVLTARAVDRVEVVEAGAATDAELAFALSFEWNGRTIPAVGVPVAFRLGGASAVLESGPVTDRSGIAQCRILRANGPPGDYALEVGLDCAAADAALAWVSGLGEAGSADGAAASRGETPCPDHSFVALASVPVHLVMGAHATSVCLDLAASRPNDAAQVMAGFTRRMERDGFVLADCGPEAGVVITAEFEIGASERGGKWTAEVALTASAFDQRTASRLAEATITAIESVEPAPTGEPAADGRRSAEVLALKEAGRLLAVYFEGRILSSGS